MEIYEYTPGFVHAKVFTSDDEKAVVGTVNMDYRSFYHHFEDGVLFIGTPKSPMWSGTFRIRKRNV